MKRKDYWIVVALALTASLVGGALKKSEGFSKNS